MRFDLAEGFPGGDHEVDPHALGHPRAPVVSSRARRTSAISTPTASPSGTSGPTRAESWVRSTARSGGAWATARRRSRSIRSRASWTASAATRTPGATSSRPGTSPISTAWPFPRATSCSSSTSPAAGSRASSTSEAPTYSSGALHISSYSLLTMMIAQVTGLEPGEFVLTLGDTHLYLNHLGQADTQLGREPYPLPQMELNPSVGSISEFTTTTSPSWATSIIRVSRRPSRCDGGVTNRTAAAHWRTNRGRRTRSPSKRRPDWRE